MNQHSTIGISNLLQKVISPGDVVLDLGSFTSGTTRAFLKQSCRCYVEDLPDFIKNLDVLDKETISHKLQQHLMILSSDVKVDLILTWDLFHYLSLNAIYSLFELLSINIKTGTIVHATRHTSLRIPKKPQNFKLLDDFSFEAVETPLTLEPENSKLNNSHATIELLQKLQHFNLYDTFTHKSKSKKELVEYVLRYGKFSGSLSSQKKRPSHSQQSKMANLLSEQEFNHIELPHLKKQLTHRQQSIANYMIDFSGPLVSNQPILSKVSQHVFEENAYSFMAWQQQIAIGQDFKISDQILQYHSSVKFDLVMLWDLVNFWELHQIKAFMKKITQHMAPLGLLHLVLPYSGSAAKQPANYQITNSLNVRVNGELHSKNNGKVLTTSQLVRLLANFKVHSYYFGTRDNAENYQEYLFEYHGTW